MTRLVCLFAVVALVATAPGCFRETPPRNSSGTKSPGESSATTSNSKRLSDSNLTDEQKQVRALVRSEELLQSLAPQMSRVSAAMRDRTMPRDEFMDPQVDYRGLADFDLAQAMDHYNRKDVASHLSWPLQTVGENVAAAKVWARLLDCQSV